LAPKTLKQLYSQSLIPLSRVLKIWWDKGFTLEEDEALRQLVSKWSNKVVTKSSFLSIALTSYPRRLKRASDWGSLIALFKVKSLAARLAWEGKLADISDVIEPIENLYPEAALKTVNFYNKTAQKRSYYAPIHQATIHAYYWRDLLVGRSESDIPRTGMVSEFWKQMQNELRAADRWLRLAAIGCSRRYTYQTFEQILEAYDVQILDAKGQPGR